MVDIMQMLPSQSIREKDTLSHNTAKIVAESGSADANKLVFCPPMIFTAVR